MNRFLCSALVVLLAADSFADAPTAYDWPQWQGHHRDGISSETGLLQEWPADGPPLAWRVNGLGGGDSAPSIAEGRIFGMSNRGEEEVVWALSESDGKELWVRSLGPALQQQFPQSKEGPGCTPTVDGDHLYVLGMSGALACLRVADGEIVWQRDLKDDFGGVAPMWNFRESPLVDGDKLICTPGAEDATLVALDKMTGEVVWKSKPPEGSSTPAPAPGDAEVPRRPDGPRPGNRTGRGPQGGDAAPATEVSGTEDPGLFASEHWGMTSFSAKVPDGKYVAKLYFAETYEGITGKGQRVFSFNVEGKEFKDFDVWEKAGGLRRAYIESVPVEVADGEFRIEFTAQVENPAIKAIELIPETASDVVTPVRINAGASEPFTDSKGQIWQTDTGFEGGSLNPGFGASAGGPPRGRFGGGRPGGFGGFSQTGAAYSSPIAIDFGGKRQYVQLTAKALIGVDSADGSVLWEYPKPANRMGINCTTPLYHDGIVFASSAYGAGGGAAKLRAVPDGTIEATELYFTNRMQNHHGGIILLDGCLYGANGGNGGGNLICIDFETGDVLWDERRGKQRIPKGSITYADARLYYRTEEGTMLLIEPSREKYIERGRFEQPDRTDVPAWAHPVIANGKMYVRDQDTLFCYDIKTKQ
jgi:alcohol dehydrogenase (cytochrome c)